MHDPVAQSPATAPPPSPHRPSARGLIVALIALGAATAACQLLPYDTTVNKALALTLFIGILWLTEAIHLAVTALLVPLGALLLGFPDLSTTKAFAPFADPIVFLFLGGFALATALRIQQLDRKMAMALLALAKGHLGTAVCLLFAATAILSTAISNTATAALMLPLALGILSPLDPTRDRSTHSFVLLGVAYAASIGGLGSIVGSPPNAIAARAAGISFASWLWIGIPLVCLLMPLMTASLWLVFRPKLQTRIHIEIEAIPWTRPRLLTMAVFALTALGWTLGASLLKAMGIQSPDTFFAVLATAAVVSLGLASWPQIAAHTDWGVLILFGGGLALSEILGASGASVVLGEQIASHLRNAPPAFTVLAIVAFMVLLSEFASNTAAAALLVPVFASIAPLVGMPVHVIVIIVAIGASYGFALPVATPPNALVYGTGRIAQRDMLTAGSLLDAICIAVTTVWALAALTR